MSADNWRECPKCNKKLLLSKEAEQKKADDSYGKVTRGEYLDLVALAKKPIKLEQTLREDYHIFVNLEGEFIVSYECHCQDCGFSFSYSDRKTVK